MGGVQTIVLLVVAIDSEVLFQSLISLFGLSIAFRMYPEVKWSFMSNAVPRDQKKWDMNSIPQSEVMWLGTLCLEKTCKWIVVQVEVTWWYRESGWKVTALRDNQQWLESRCNWKTEGASLWNPWIWNSKASRNQKLLWEVCRVCGTQVLAWEQVVHNFQ